MVVGVCGDEFGWGSEVPELDCPVGAAGEEKGLVWGYVYGGDLLGVAFEDGGGALAGAEIPEFDGCVEAAGRQSLVIKREGSKAGH